MNDWPPEEYTPPSWWNSVLSSMREWLSSHEYERWIDSLAAAEGPDGVVVAAPHELHAIYVREKHKDLLEDALENCAGKSLHKIREKR